MKAAADSAGEVENRRIYTKTNKRDSLEATLIYGSYKGTEFTTFTEHLVVAGSFMICPVNDDKHPACLTFSLKGITAALKAICPKR